MSSNIINTEPINNCPITGESDYFSDYIIKSLPNFKGKFIVFLPEIKII